MKYKELVEIMNIHQTITIMKHDNFNPELLNVVPGGLIKCLKNYYDMEVVSFCEVNDCLTIYLK